MKRVSLTTLTSSKDPNNMRVRHVYPEGVTGPLPPHSAHPSPEAHCPREPLSACSWDCYNIS